ncbi:hypothetical protein [Natranaerobius trueperi]|nr:hypothetical protein [Natranaerobius trueperi]
MNSLEEKSPGTKNQFYLGFLREEKKFFGTDNSTVSLSMCQK